MKNKDEEEENTKVNSEFIVNKRSPQTNGSQSVTAEAIHIIHSFHFIHSFILSSPPTISRIFKTQRIGTYAQNNNEEYCSRRLWNIGLKLIKST